MTMRAAVSSAEGLPFCSFYNEESSGGWESSGLVIDAVKELPGTDSGAVDVLVTCTSFHLSDFSVTTTTAEPVFKPVSLVRDARKEAQRGVLANAST